MAWQEGQSAVRNEAVPKDGLRAVEVRSIGIYRAVNGLAHPQV